MKKIIYLIIGFTCFGIGAVGVVLPVLPTTPFLLVASFCFAKGSERFHNWFINTSVYKKHLESFVNSKSMTMRTKMAILLPVTLMMLLAAYFVPNNHARYFIFAALAFKYYYFSFRIKTEKPQKSKDEQ